MVDILKRALDAVRRIIDPRYRAEQEIRRTFNPEMLRRNPELLRELTRIKMAEYQAKALPALIFDAITNPQDTAAERRYGTALKQQGARATTGAQMQGTSALQRLLNTLQAPQRGVVAWTTQIAGPGSKYNTGADAWGDDAEWGALLENYFPHWNVWLRRGLAIPMDLALDPLNFIPLARAANLALEAAYGVAPKAASAGVNLSYILRALADELLHPTAYRIAEQAGAAEKRTRFLQELADAWKRGIGLKQFIELARMNRDIARKNPRAAEAMRRHTREVLLRMTKPGNVLNFLSEQWRNLPITAMRLYNRQKALHENLHQKVSRNILQALEDTMDEADELSFGLPLYDAYIRRHWGALANRQVLEILPPDLQEAVKERIVDEANRLGRGYYNPPHVSPDAPSAFEGWRLLNEQRRPPTAAEKLANALMQTTFGQRAREAAIRLGRFLAGEPIRDLLESRPWTYDIPIPSETIDKINRYLPFARALYNAAPGLYQGLMEHTWRWLLLRHMNRVNSSLTKSYEEQ